MFYKAVFMVLPFVFLTLTVRMWLRPLALGAQARRLWFAWLAISAAKFVAFAALGGDAFCPELPAPLIWVWNWAYSGLVILCALAVVLRLAGLVVRPQATHGRALRLWLLPAVAWGAAAFGVWNGIKVPAVREVALECGCLPDGLDGYRIALLADLHASASAEGWRTREIVRRVNACAPDLICLAGDYADSPAARADRLEPLTELQAKDGVWAVMGNHEYYHDRELWREWFARAGFRFLENACVFPRAGLALGGVPDETVEKLGEPLPDPAAAFASATNGEFRILLAHRPRRAREYFAASRFNLQLSGHTHGGIMPILSWLVAWHNAGYVRGKYELSGPNHLLYVSPGAGQWAGFPVRFFDPAEITLITLRK